MIFTDRNGWILGDSDFELTVVDEHWDENEAPLKIENENNIDYQKDHEEFHPNQEDQPIQQPVKV